MGMIEERRRMIIAEMERGRGSGHAFPHPVSIEPPFAPFGLKSEREPFFGRVIRSPKERTVLSEKAHGIHDPRFIRIKPSGEDKNTLEMAEQLIISLPVTSPVAFEVVGRDGRISFQMAVEESRADAVVSQIGAHYPGADIYPGEDLIGDASPSHAIVRAYRLKTTHFLPLTLHSEGDPYRTLFGCLGSLGQGQTGVLQVLFAPVVYDWPGNMRLASRNSYDSSSPFIDLPNLPKSVDKKLSRQLYAVVLRMLASDTLLLAGMEGFLKQFESENGLVPVAGIPARSLIERSTHTHGFLLSSTELAYFVHLPAPELLDSFHGINRARKSFPVPAEFGTDGPVLGYSLHRGTRRAVCHSSGLPNRHVYCLGASGQGKSNLILSVVTKRMERGEGVAVIDPHGALIREGILPRVPRKRIEDVVYFNAGDFEHPMAINPLAHGGTKLEKEHIRVDQLSFFEDLFDAPLGVTIQHTLNFIIITLLTRRDSTIQDIERILMDKSWRARLIQTIEDDRIRFFWEMEYPALEKKGIVTSIANKLSPLILPDSAIAPMLTQRENRLDFRKIMDEKRILLCNLSHGDIGKRNSQLLGKLLVSKLQIAAMMREGNGASPDFYLYIDEFQHMVCPSMADILSGARKYGLHLWLANQMAGDIPESIMRHVFNASTLIIFSTDNPHDQALMEKTFARKFTAEDIGQLKKGEAFVKMGAHVFSLVTEKAPEPPAINWVNEIIASRERYTTSVSSTREDDRNEKEKQTPREAARPQETRRRTAASSRAFSFLEKAFLERVYQKPALTVTGLYKDLGLSAYMGDKLKTALKDKGLLHEVSTHLGPGSRVAKFLLLTPKKGFKALGVDFGAGAGKGGPLHRYYQSVIKFHAEGNGYRAVIEEPIPGNTEAVDIGLEREGERTAIEISITTTADHELDNLNKCVEAGYDKVIVLAHEEKKAVEIQALIDKALAGEEKTLVSVGLVYDFCRFL